MTVIPVVLGLASGVAGALLTEAYLSVPAPSPALIQIGQPSPAAAPTMLAQSDLADRLRRVDVPLYPRKTAAGADLADRARAPYEAVAYAAALTSDGWLVTSQSALSQGPVEAEVDGHLLTPQSQVSDPRTGMLFLKIDASALPVVGFSDTQALRSGSAMYAEGPEHLFTQATFAGSALPDRKTSPPSLRDTDKFARVWRLDRSSSLLVAGGAVMTSDGEMAGILAQDGAGAAAFVPMHLLQPIMTEVFRGQAPVRAQLGAHYLAPDETAFADQNLTGLTGVRLSGSRAAGVSAVRPGSASARAGLQDGDIIQRIDGVDLAQGTDLAEMVAQYLPGDKARFDILRKGERLSLDVTFD